MSKLNTCIRSVAWQGLLGLGLAFAASSNAQLPPTNDGHSRPDDPVVLEPVAARYVEIRQAGTSKVTTRDWYFYRDGDRVATIQEDYAEIWQRDDQHALTLQRVFPSDRKIIAYTTGELRTQGRLREWGELAYILDPRVLGTLREAGAVAALDQPAMKYRGRVGDMDLDVLWLPRPALPAKLTRVSPEVSVTIELLELRNAPDSGWPRVGADSMADFDVIDGADLGDLEGDTFVRKVMSMESAGHSHTH